MMMIKKDADILGFYNKLKKMSYKQFEERIQEYGMSAFEMGLREGEAEGAMWTDVEVFDILRKHKIGVERAVAIVEELLERDQ